MLKTLLLVLSFLSCTILNAADNYQVGDTLFVWAKHGLNVRKGPTTKSAILAKVPFGERIVVIEKSDVTFYVTGIKPDTAVIKDMGPVIFKGNWVLVRLANGIQGFVIDQYLLKFQPVQKKLDNGYILNLKVLSIDTLYKRPHITDGEGLNNKVKKVFEGGIILIERNGGVWFENQYTFPNFSIEEVLVLFSSTHYDFENFVAGRNWTDEIRFRDDGICSFIVTLEGKTVKVKMSCAC